MANTQFTQIVIVDTVQNNIDTLYPGEDFFEKIDRVFGKCRGDIFQLVEETVPVTLDQKQLDGSSQFTTVARSNYEKATRKIVEEWQWTGRSWKQLR